MNETHDQIERLYRLHGHAILGYLRRLCGSGDAPEDLLQETFVQAIRCSDALAEALSPRAWLYGVARNVGRGALRRQRRFAPLPAEVPGPAGPAADPRLEQMRHVIQDLPDAQREALSLRLENELSYEEIAAVTNVPVGTVRSRLHGAVRRLRAMLVADDRSEMKS